MNAGRPDEVRALSALAFAQLREATGGIGALHRAIADRSFGPVALARAPRPRRDRRRRLPGRRRGLLRDRGGRRPRVGRPAPRRPTAPVGVPRGAAALAVLTGLIGDHLEAQQSDLHQPMTVRVGGRAVAIEPAGVAQAFPDATGRLVVFVHGLMETEHAWRRSGADSYGTRLRRDAGLTAVYVRANTGRPIADNGGELAALVDELVDSWPVAVTEIAFVGHSMGGLLSPTTPATGPRGTAPPGATACTGSCRSARPMRAHRSPRRSTRPGTCWLSFPRRAR